jgi:hypothetical protein
MNLSHHFSTTVVLSGILGVAVFSAMAQSDKPKPHTKPGKETALESPEHAFARAEHEALKQQLTESNKDFGERVLRDGPRCEILPVPHPVTLSVVESKTVDCSYETKKARFVMEQLSEEVEHSAYRLKHVDECLRTYRETIDRKPAALTPEESEQIKQCQAAELYPPWRN